MSGINEIDIQWFIFELPQTLETNVSTLPPDAHTVGFLLKISFNPLVLGGGVKNVKNIQGIAFEHLLQKMIALI